MGFRMCRTIGSLAMVVTLAACDITTSDGDLKLGLASGKAEDTWTRRYPLEPGGRLELINVNGRIDAEPADGSAVELSARRTAKGTSDDAARGLLGQIDMREEAGPSKVRVEVRPPRLRGLSGHEIRWTVKVPKGVEVDFRTTNGGVTVSRIDGPVAASVANGSVVGRALGSSRIFGKAVNGSVQVEISSPLPSDGEVKLDCVNGRVSLSLPAESKATIDARAVNGGVSVSGLTIDPTEQTPRRLSGTINGGGARVSAEAINGGVRITRSGIGGTD